MGRVSRIFKKSILSSIFIILMGAGLCAAPIVDVYFSPAVQQAQRNSYFTTSIVVSSNENIQIDGVDANFFYDQSIFLEPDINSNIGNWMISIEDVSIPGKVTYQKGSDGSTEYYSVTAGVPKTIYTIEFRVAAGAQLVTKNFVFQNGFINITAQGESGNLVASSPAGEIGLIPDTTPPITTASKASGLYNTVQYITLAKHSSDRANDLKEIRYTLSNTPGNTPNITSPLYTSPLQIPANTKKYVLFFGVDYYNNQELPNSRVYEIDTIAPAVLNLKVSPNFCKAGERVVVSFSTNEPLLGGAPASVQLGGRNFNVSQNAYPHYIYYLDINGTEPEGSNTVEIRLTDLAGNQHINSEETVTFDFTPPKYLNPRLAAISPTQVLLEFTASEQLSTLNTTISTSGIPWVFNSRNDLLYRYTFTKSGSETSKLIEVHGYDLAGNNSWNTTGWNVVKVRGRDLYNNWDENTATINIDYSVQP